MRRLWLIYRNACVATISLALVAGALLGVTGVLHALTATPVATIPSPDGAFRVEVFSAGQGNLPPDYRADVRFYLYERSHWRISGGTLIAAAALADGWSITWPGPRSVLIRSGRLSWFDTALPEAHGVSIEVRPATRPQEEARCLEQSFASTVDGVVCFDALLQRAEVPAAGRH